MTFFAEDNVPGEEQGCSYSHTEMLSPGDSYTWFTKLSDCDFTNVHFTVIALATGLIYANFLNAPVQGEEDACDFEGFNGYFSWYALDGNHFRINTDFVPHTN